MFKVQGSRFKVQGGGKCGKCGKDAPAEILKNLSRGLLHVPRGMCILLYRVRRSCPLGRGELPRWRFGLVGGRRTLTRPLPAGEEMFFGKSVVGKRVVRGTTGDRCFLGYLSPVLLVRLYAWRAYYAEGFGTRKAAQDVPGLKGAGEMRGE